jgi:hypothetical protein
VPDTLDVSVEELCLQHYRAAGWQGWVSCTSALIADSGLRRHHSENSILTTLV